MPSALGRVLVTGANGHLGRKLLTQLAEVGEKPLAVVRSQRAADQVASLPEQTRPQTAIVAYADADAMARAARGCSAVVHLVGIIKESSSTSYRAAHEDTCEVLVRAAATAGVRRIVYLSIFGASRDSQNPCLASKGRAEEILLAGVVPATILRVPMVLGEGDFASRSLRAQARARIVPLVGGGATLQQPIDARDVIAAIAAAIASTEDGPSVLDLGGPETLSQRALVERAGRLFGNHPRILSIPLWAARLGAALGERLSSNPPITGAMLGILQHDDEIDSSGACARLGIELTPLDETLRRCVGPEAP